MVIFHGKMLVHQRVTPRTDGFDEPQKFFKTRHQDWSLIQLIGMLFWLVLEPYPSEKYEFVSWDDSSQYMDKNMFQTTNQFCVFWKKKAWWIRRLRPEFRWGYMIVCKKTFSSEVHHLSSSNPSTDGWFEDLKRPHNFVGPLIPQGFPIGLPTYVPQKLIPQSTGGSPPVDFPMIFTLFLAGWWLSHPSDQWWSSSMFVSWDDEIPNMMGTS